MLTLLTPIRMRWVLLVHQPLPQAKPVDLPSTVAHQVALLLQAARHRARMAAVACLVAVGVALVPSTAMPRRGPVERVVDLESLQAVAAVTLALLVAATAGTALMATCGFAAPAAAGVALGLLLVRQASAATAAFPVAVVEEGGITGPQIRPAVVTAVAASFVFGGSSNESARH